MSLQPCELLDATLGSYYTVASSAMSVPASTWTKVVSLDTTDLSAGKYLIISLCSRQINDKVSYARLTYNNDGNNVLAGGNTPYYSGDLIAPINIDSSVTSVEFWVFSTAITLDIYSASLKAIKIA